MKILLTILICLTLTFSAFGNENIKLTSKNHVLLRGEVTDDSVAEISARLLNLSAKIPETEIIYLVIDSGGGSVFAGIDLLNVMNIIPQKIYTISIFAFSMAYSISQRGEKRYITPRGIMGQHRAKGGFSGQFAVGEVEQRLKIMTEVIIDLETYEAKRMDISLEEFQKLIKDEMYVYDLNAVEKKVADEKANISCSKQLLQERMEVKQCSFFGCITSEFSKCPLVRGSLPEIKNKKQEEE